MARKPVIPGAPPELRTFLERLVTLLNDCDDLSLENVARVLGMPLEDFKWDSRKETAFNFEATVNDFYGAFGVSYTAPNLRGTKQNGVWLHIFCGGEVAFDWLFVRSQLADMLGPSEVQWAPRKDKNANSPGGWVRYPSTRDPRMSLIALFDVSKSDRAIMYFDAVMFELKKASELVQ
jgi:hypothetical protein